MPGPNACHIEVSLQQDQWTPVPINSDSEFIAVLALLRTPGVAFNPTTQAIEVSEGKPAQ
jgi:hypothetical protein